MQHLIDRWKSSENMDVERCAAELESLVSKVYTEPPTEAQYDAHVAKHGPWMRILIDDPDCCREKWMIASIRWFNVGYRKRVQASIPGTSWTVGAGHCIGYQWSNSKGLPVEAPGEKTE